MIGRGESTSPVVDAHSLAINARNKEATEKTCTLGFGATFRKSQQAPSQDRAYLIYCGGLAMAVHGYPRATKDIDLLIHPDDLPRIEAVVNQAGFDVPGGP